MDHPTKEEFQELIDTCNQNSFVILIDNEHDIVKSAKDALKSFIETRVGMYKEMKLLRAYQWMLVSCENNIDSLCPDLIKDKQRSIVYYNERIISIYNRLSKGGLDSEKIKENLQKYLNNLARCVQDREQIISHISKCLKNYYYSVNDLTPTSYNIEINQAIKDLKKAHKSIVKLKKYNSLFFVSSFTDGEGLLNELECLEAIQRNAMFPSKSVKLIKSGGKHEITVLIVSVTKWFLLNGGIIKTGDEGGDYYQFIDVLKLNESLINLIEQSMTSKSIGEVMNKEINRIKSDTQVYSLYQSPNAKRRRKAIIELTRAHRLNER